VVTVDVAVVGGGPAGCAAAAAALGHGASCGVIDPWVGSPEAPGPQVGECAAPGIDRLVHETFARDAGAFRAERHVPCAGVVSAWGAAEARSSQHVFDPMGMGWNLDRAWFDRDLRDAVVRSGACPIRARVRVAQRSSDGWSLRIKDADGSDRSVRARVLIDGSGRSAAPSRRQGAVQRHLDHLVALWSLWEVDQADRHSSLFVEASEQGWWYSSLLPGRRRVVALLTDADLLPRHRTDRQSLACSARHLPLIGGVLGAGPGATPVGVPIVRIARSSHLDPPLGPGWLAAGDAAHAIDPLSGRGIASALITGRAAGDAAAALLQDPRSEREAAAYRALLGDLFDDGRAQWLAAYGSEQRWPAAPFWSRRHACSMADRPCR
jgi:flavin-dependent dehydrogenase